MYEKLVESILKNQSDAAMCGFTDFPHGAPVEKGIFSVPPCGFSGAVFQMMRRNGFFTSLWAKLISKRLVFITGQPTLFDTDLSFGEDEVWLLQVLRDCKAVSFVPEPLYYWRAREGSVTRFGTITERQLSILKAKKKTLQLLPDDRRLLRLARGRIYNDCFWLKVQAYCSGWYSPSKRPALSENRSGQPG